MQKNIDLTNITEQEIHTMLNKIINKQIAQDNFYSANISYGNDSCEIQNSEYFTVDFDKELWAIFLDKKTREKIINGEKIKINDLSLYSVGSIPSYCNRCHCTFAVDGLFNCEDTGSCIDNDIRHDRTFNFAGEVNNKLVLNLFRFFEKILGIKFKRGNNRIITLDMLEKAYENKSEDIYDIYFGDYRNFIKIDYSFKEAFFLSGGLRNLFNLFDSPYYLLLVKDVENRKFYLVLDIKKLSTYPGYLDIEYHNGWDATSSSAPIEYAVEVTYLKDRYIDLKNEYINFNIFDIKIE